MSDKIVFEKQYGSFVKQFIRLELWLFSSKPYRHNSFGFKFFYLGLSGLLVFCVYSLLSTTKFLPAIILTTLLFFPVIVINIYTLIFIQKKGKISWDKEFLIKPSIFKERERIHKNLGFTFPEDHLTKIFKRMLLYGFINQNTRFEDFHAVFISDFGHNRHIQWNITLSQLGQVLAVLKNHSTTFTPSLAIREQLFKSNQGDFININSYNNANSYQNKKIEEYYFKSDFLQFTDFMKHLVD